MSRPLHSVVPTQESPDQFIERITLSHLAKAMTGVAESAKILLLLDRCHPSVVSALNIHRYVFDEWGAIVAKRSLLKRLDSLEAHNLIRFVVSGCDDDSCYQITAKGRKLISSLRRIV